MKNIIILGSGRSGTSMIAGAFEKAGYSFGENSNYLGKNLANKNGFFEDWEINTLNEDILDLTLPKIPEKIRNSFFPFLTTYRFRWFARIPLWVKIKSSSAINERIEKVLENFPFCYKDPRFSYTLPIWNKFLKEDVVFIVVYRHPSRTAESIVRECIDSNITKRIKMNEKLALKVWFSMYSHILRNYNKSNKKESWFFIHYDQVSDKQKIESLEKFTIANFDSSSLNKSWSRTTEKEIDIIEIKKMYCELNKLSNYSSF